MIIAVLKTTDERYTPSLNTSVKKRLSEKSPYSREEAFELHRVISPHFSI